MYRGLGNRYLNTIPSNMLNKEYVSPKIVCNVMLILYIYIYIYTGHRDRGAPQRHFENVPRHRQHRSPLVDNTSNQSHELAYMYTGLCIMVNIKWATNFCVRERISTRPPRELGQVTVILVDILGPDYTWAAERDAECYNRTVNWPGCVCAWWLQQLRHHESPAWSAPERNVSDAPQEDNRSMLQQHPWRIPGTKWLSIR
jgi:hypothetical protein